MIRGGNATVFVSDLDRAVGFYTQTLGLKLDYRGGEEWAQIDAGDGLKLGLHLASEKSVRPGSRGSISIGFYATEPLDSLVPKLQQRGVAFHGPIVDDASVRLAFLGDPDGNELYLCEVIGNS